MSTNGWRSRDEMDRFASSVSSGIMHQLSSAHLKTTIDKIKVG